MNFKISPALLFTPGDKPERFRKAEQIGANGIILDLEDAVAEQEKDKARDIVFNYLSQSQSSTILKFIRINPLTTKAGLIDLQLLSEKKINCDGIVYPKTESADEINIIATLVSTANDGIPILGLIETAKGIANLTILVRESVNLSALMFGAADYSADVGCESDFATLYYARMTMIQAAALKNIACYDSPFFNFKDDEGLLNEAKAIKRLGFSGKLAIHPNQVPIIRSAFKPSTADVQEAEAIVQMFDAAKGQACQYQGRMIDKPVYLKAKEIIALYRNLS